ncbi:MAG TPA: hypothetical protein VFD19_05240 [Clostridia bacterium]|nr:hypothetical protein [Clostridia bacterium]
MNVEQLKTIYQSVEMRLSRIDFETIWPGFAPVDFALYTPEKMYFQGELAARPQGFMGNTAIEYEGAFIAIWNMMYTKITGEESLDLLASKLVHEMFHAFQKQQGETRFPDDLDLLLYPLDEKLIALTRRESAILSDPAVYAGHSPTKAMEGLRSIVSIRADKTRVCPSATNHEHRAETFEGLAEYAGLRGLFQINPKLANENVQEYRQHLRDDKYLFDIRRRCYYSGALIALLAQAAGLTVSHSLRSEHTFWDLLDVRAAAIDPLRPDDLCEAHSLATKERDRRRQLLESFKARADQERPMDAAIVGYDPMNLTRIDDYLISTHFLMIDDGVTPLPLMGDHLVRMKRGDPRRVVAVLFGSS